MEIEYSKKEVEEIVRLHFWQNYDGVSRPKFLDDKWSCNLDNDDRAIILISDNNVS